MWIDSLEWGVAAIQTNKFRPENVTKKKMCSLLSTVFSSSVASVSKGDLGLLYQAG